MACAKGVVFGLGSFGEAREAAALADGVDATFSPCQDFVRIALVANVPDELVFGGVEHGVDRGCKLDYAEACAQVPTGFGNRADGGAADIIGQLFDFIIGEGFDVGRCVHAIED